MNDAQTKSAPVLFLPKSFFAMETRPEIEELMKLLSPLSTEGKLEIISRLTGELKTAVQTRGEDKAMLLDQLFGAWAGTDDDLAERILEERSAPGRDIHLD